MRYDRRQNLEKIINVIVYRRQIIIVDTINQRSEKLIK